jgi:hypothetical protein
LKSRSPSNTSPGRATYAGLLIDEGGVGVTELELEAVLTKSGMEDSSCTGVATPTPSWCVGTSDVVVVVVAGVVGSLSVVVELVVEELVLGDSLEGIVSEVVVSLT